MARARAEGGDDRRRREVGHRHAPRRAARALAHAEPVKVRVVGAAHLDVDVEHEHAPRREAEPEEAVHLGYAQRRRHRHPRGRHVEGVAVRRHELRRAVAEEVRQHEGAVEQERPHDGIAQSHDLVAQSELRLVEKVALPATHRLATVTSGTLRILCKLLRRGAALLAWPHSSVTRLNARQPSRGHPHAQHQECRGGRSKARHKPQQLSGRVRAGTHAAHPVAGRDCGEERAPGNGGVTASSERAFGSGARSHEHQHSGRGV